MDSALVFSATLVTSSDLFSLDDVLVFDLFRLGLNLRNDVRMYEGASLKDDCFFSGDWKSNNKNESEVKIVWKSCLKYI